MTKSVKNISLFLSRVFSLKIVAVALFCLCALLSGTSQAATLNVDLDIRTKAVESDSICKQTNIAIFVLDRSGSMLNAPKKGEKLADGREAQERDQLLKESFKARMQSISANAPDTLVYYVLFSVKKGEIKGPVFLKTKSNIEEVLSELEREGYGGSTYLYDTLAHVMEFIDKRKGPSVKLNLYVYTDGENETGNDAEYPSIPGNKTQLKAAKEKFNKVHGWKFESYAEKGEMETYWRWLGSDTPPENSLKKTKDEYKVSFIAGSTSLKNPKEVPDQKLSATVVVPLSEQYVKKLDSLNVPIVLQLAGKNIDHKLLSLKPGSKSVSFQFSDEDVVPGNFKGKLILSDIPEWDSMVLKPESLELTFSSIGKLSFVTVVPKGEVFVKNGSKMDFSAKASDGAKIKWTWPEGTREGEVCPMTFTKPGTFDVLLKAEKKDILPAEEKIKVHVIDAEVGVSIATAQPTVGKGVDFAAKSNSQAKWFAWWIDNQSLSEQSANLKGYVFKSSGKHSVKVRAYYDHEIVADSGDVTFEVAAAPYIDIIEPYSGSEYAFGEQFECKASVEGDFDKVVWHLAGPDGVDDKEAGVDKAGKVSQPAFFKPAKGGDHTLTATAEGSAGKLQSKSTVTLKVAHENLGIKIDSPISNASIPLGTTEGVEFKATVKGEHIVKVKWFVRNEEGEDKEIGASPVQDGKTAYLYRPDSEIKDGAHLFVHAAAIIDDDKTAEPVVSSLIELIAERYAEIRISEDANGLVVPFGKQTNLVAVCKGDVNPANIEWFAETNGIKFAIGLSGLKCSSPKIDSSDESLLPVWYFAKAKLSDGSVKESDNKIVVYYEKQKPKASFEIKEKDTYYTVGGTLHLESTSTGNVANYIWFVNGKELTNYTGQANAVYKLPKTPCDIDIKLKVEGANSDDCNETQPLPLKVRYGKKAIAIILPAGFLLIIIFGYLLLNNGPCGWKLVCWAQEPPSSNEDEEQWCRGRGKPLIEKCWSFLDKKAIVPVTLLSKRVHFWSRIKWFNSTTDFTKLCDERDKIIVTKDRNNNRPFVRCEGSIRMEKNYKIKNTNMHYYLFDKPGNNNKDNIKLRFVVKYEAVTHKYDFLFVLACFSILGLMFWSMLKWAIALY